MLILEECDSTSSELRRRLDQGLQHGYWVSSRRQTAGRGRMGRSWVSEEGNLFLSLLLVPKTREYLTWIPILISVSIAEVLLKKAAMLPLAIKWPNDLYLDGVKCGGILVEGMGSPVRDMVLIAGIGLNLVSSPEGLDQPTRKLSDYLSAINLDVLRLEIVAQILSDFEALESLGVSKLKTRYQELSYLKAGESIRYESGVNEWTDAMIHGLGEGGELLVQKTDGTVEPLYAGDVKIRKNL